MQCPMPGTMKRRIQFALEADFSFERRFIEFNTRARSYLLVSPTVIDEQLAAARLKLREVGIHRVDEADGRV